MGRLLKKFAESFRGHKEWWADYMTEMSILVISLAATFYGEQLISDYMDTQDDKETIGIVIHEMHENIKELDDMEKYYDEKIEFLSLLRRYLIKKETIPSDTLDIFYNTYRKGTLYFLKNNAFNMMKNSGTILRMDDKQLLSQMFETYDRMNLAKDLDASSRQELATACAHFLSNINENANMDTTQEQWDEIGKNKEFRQYLLVSYSLMCKSRLAICSRAKIFMEEIVAQLEQKYGKPD